MHAMRALENLEEEIREEICKVTQCEEDDLPDDFDVLSLYNVDAADRYDCVVSMLLFVRLLYNKIYS
jgi:hypothetical protein